MMSIDLSEWKLIGRRVGMKISFDKISKIMLIMLVLALNKYCSEFKIVNTHYGLIIFLKWTCKLFSLNGLASSEKCWKFKTYE
jgi:hypothetical protein